MFNDDLIENVFSVTEYAFDAVKLKKITEDMLLEVGVEVLFSSKAVKAKRTENDRVELSVLPMCGTNKNPYVVVTKNVFNCTYAQINGLLHASNIELIPLKHEVTEMCLVQLPEQLLGKSVTVMCGPFFSFMPFPALNLTSLSHVRYTPHSHWYDDPGDYFEPYEYFASMPKKTAFPAMIRDVARYIPILSEAKYERSLWELKTTLPSSEYNDGRPILFRHNHGIPGMTCVMGGKIDNIYDVASELKIVLGESLA
jgi:hypothetical protein